MLPLKWGVPEDVIPAWVAEMDYAVDPVVLEAVQRMLADGITGYPLFGWDPALAESYAAWSARHFGWAPEPEAVHPVVDVTAGVRVAIDVFSGPGGVVFPTPGYNAQHGLARITGREEHLLEVPTSADRAEIDLDRLDRLFAEGAQTLLLTQPHNPWGRVFTRTELEGIRDVVVRHGARVVSDEIHAPLVLPGAEHVSYLSIEGTHDHAVAVVAASKAFNTAGLRCAQIVVPDVASQRRLVDQPMSRNDSHSPVGVVAARAAYDGGDGWLASLVERLDQQRTLLGELLAGAPARGADAPAGGDLPRVAGRDGLRARRRRRRGTRAGPGDGERRWVVRARNHLSGASQHRHVAGPAHPDRRAARAGVDQGRRLTLAAPLRDT